MTRIFAMMLLTAWVLLPNRTAAMTKNACDAASNLISMHATFASMVNEVRLTNSLAKKLHHNSRSSPYKRIEDAVRDMRMRTKVALKQLSGMVITLDAYPTAQKKEAAIKLIAAYWNGIELLSDYADTALLFEREENLVSMNVNGRSYLSFGVNKGAPQVAGDNYARDQLESKADEVPEAVRLPIRAEARYAKVCGLKFISDNPAQNPKLQGAPSHAENASARATRRS